MKPWLVTKELFWILKRTEILNSWQFFKGQYYLQTHRTALGTRLVGSYANTFMVALETEIILNAHHGLIPLIEWIRYIDDIFAMWPHGLESIRSIISALQSNSTTSTRKSVHILVTTIYMYFNDKHQLESELHIKPTDKTLRLHSILHSTRTHVNEVLSTAKRYDTNGLSQVTKI